MKILDDEKSEMSHKSLCSKTVSSSGHKRGEGMMTFPDFYPSEHSEDGMLWSFLSRDGVKLIKRWGDPKKSVYFKV